MNKIKKKSLVFLTGFMGSGKSTIAPLLASTIGYDYLDIDTEIEKRLGKKVTQIFQEYGEAFFREFEHSLLDEFSRKDHCVISLGGGTIVHNNNLATIKSSGILVYLKAEPAKLLKRLRYKTDRPLLQSVDGGLLDEQTLRQRIEEIMSSREPFYNQADIIVLTNDKRVGITVDEIAKRINKLIE